MASHDREVPPPPPPGPHGRAVNPEEEIPALNRGHRRDRSVKSAHLWLPFDIRAREPGEIDRQVGFQVKKNVEPSGYSIASRQDSVILPSFSVATFVEYSTPRW